MRLSLFLLLLLPISAIAMPDINMPSGYQLSELSEDAEVWTKGGSNIVFYEGYQKYQGKTAITMKELKRDLKKISQIKARELALFGIKNYQITKAKVIKGKTRPWDFAVMSSGTYNNWQGAKKYFRQITYYKNKNVYSITNTADKGKNLESSKSLNNSVRWNSGGRGIASTSTMTEAGAAGCTDCKVAVKNAFTPLQEVSDKICENVPLEKRNSKYRKYEGISGFFKRVMNEGSSGAAVGAVTGVALGAHDVVVDLAKLIIGTGKYAINSKYRQEINSMVAVFFSEVKEDPKGMAKQLWSMLDGAMGKYMDEYHCLNARAKTESITRFLTILVAEPIAIIKFILAVAKGVKVAVTTASALDDVRGTFVKVKGVVGNTLDNGTLNPQAMQTIQSANLTTAQLSSTDRALNALPTSAVEAINRRPQALRRELNACFAR